MSLNDKSIHSNFEGSSTISVTVVEKSDQSVMRLLLSRIAVVLCLVFTTGSVAGCFDVYGKKDRIFVMYCKISVWYV